MCAHCTVTNKQYYRSVEMVLYNSTPLYMYLIHNTVIIYY